MSTSKFGRLAVVSLLLVLAMNLWSAAAPDKPAPEAPKDKPRRLMAPPAGFAKATTQALPGLVVYYDPADQAAVDKALGVFRASERNPLLPGSIAKRLAEKDGKTLADLKTMVKADLDWNDEKAVGDFVNSINDQLNKIEANQITFFYLLTSQQNFKDLVKDKKWGSEQFTYNKVRDDVDQSFNAAMPEDGPADETIIPALYGNRAETDAKAAALVEVIYRFENQRIQTVINTTQMRLMHTIALGIKDNVTKSLDLKLSQQWFGYGLEGFYTAKYMSVVVGLSATDYLQQYIQPTRDPIASDSLDLSNPQDPTNLKAELVGAYENAMRARSTELTMWWALAKGERVISKSIAAIKEAKPKGGAALLELIKDKTDTDLAPDLKPRPQQ
jgi:hypothetical protein